MKSKLTSLISLIALIFSISPLAVLAAGTDITFGSGVNVGITIGGAQENFTLLGDLETVTVNASNVSIGVNSGSGASLTDTSKRNFSYGSGISGTLTCGASSSVLNISGTTQVAEVVTPLGTTCTTSGGGGGGGGGSTTATAEPTTTTATPTTAAVAPTTTTAPASTLAVAPATTPTATVAQPSAVAQLVSPVFNSDLSIGTENDDVKRLQELLAKDKEIYSDGRVTGYFGPLTSAAVKKFQAKYGLPQVGRVGPATRAKLNEVFGSATPVAQPAPTAQAASPVFNSDLVKGAKNDDVKRLQTLLAQDKDIYPEGLTTGLFGPATERAVKKFQAKYGLPQVGRVGPATRAKLNEVFGGQSSNTPAAENSASEEAQKKAMEKQLKDLQDLLNSLKSS